MRSNSGGGQNGIIRDRGIAAVERNVCGACVIGEAQQVSAL
ncbi:hypothetical protein [Acetobacter estunensis]|nr:hypothetical protein [Acetobacter estunensis]